jgi:hypothetical protein
LFVHGKLPWHRKPQSASVASFAGRGPIGTSYAWAYECNYNSSKPGCEEVKMPVNDLFPGYELRLSGKPLRFLSVKNSPGRYEFRIIWRGFKVGEKITFFNDNFGKRFYITEKEYAD